MNTEMITKKTEVKQPKNSEKESMLSLEYLPFIC